MFPPGKKKNVSADEITEYIDIPDDEEGDDLEEDDGDDDDDDDDDDDEGVAWGLWDGVKAIARDWWEHNEEE